MRESFLISYEQWEKMAQERERNLRMEIEATFIGCTLFFIEAFAILYPNWDYL